MPTRYFDEIGVLKAGSVSLNILAWDNKGNCPICWLHRLALGLIGAVGGISTWKLEVKFLDFPMTT